jgi:hypothetical protein
MSVPRFVLALLAVLVLVAAPASSALAYGKENYQVTFSGTGTVPGGGGGFGFWGWCAFGSATTFTNGVATAGTDGDCQFAQYGHGSGGSGFTCEESLEITSWFIGPNGDFIISGTVTVNPSTQTAACVASFPGSNPFTAVDSLLLATPGHHDFGSLGPGLKGKFVEQVTLIP